MSTSRQLADFVTELQFGDIPAPVIERAKEMALHAWGVQLAASTLPWSKLIYRYVRDQGGVEQSRVINYGLKTSAANAAFANSAFSHGFEMDDNHGMSAIKGGCVIVPTALAVGERELSSGRDVLTAMVAGYEVMLRLGLTLRASATVRGSHPTGTNGAVGAATVASKLMGMPPEIVAHALNAAAASRSGYSEAPTSGRGHLKRVFGAMAASSGIRAADLAHAGLNGPETTLDVGSGMCRAFDVDEEQHALLTGELGGHWELMNVHFKIYAQDGYIQPISEALERIREAHEFSVDDVESVWVGTNHRAHDEIIGPIRDPRNLTDAQFSGNFSVALYLVRGGASFADYTEEALADPEIRDLAAQVTIDIDDEIDREYRKSRPRGAKVCVRLKSGEEYREHVPNLRQMTSEDLDAKFRSLSRVVLDEATSEQLLERGHALDQVSDITTIAPMLVRGQ